MPQPLFDMNLAQQLVWPLPELYLDKWHTISLTARRGVLADASCHCEFVEQYGRPWTIPLLLSLPVMLIILFSSSREAS